MVKQNHMLTVYLNGLKIKYNCNIMYIIFGSELTILRLDIPAVFVTLAVM